MPWLKLIALLEPAYPTSGRRGRQPMPLASMLRIQCMQAVVQFFRSADTQRAQVEDALYQVESARQLCWLFSSVTDARCPMKPPSSTFVIYWRSSN